MRIQYLKRLLIQGLIISFSMAPTAGLAAAADASAAVKESLAKHFPKLKVDSIQAAPMKGFYQVISGDRVLFVNEDGYVFLGNLWSPDGKNLTAEIHDKLTADKLKKLPLDKAVKIGNGPRIVIEFDDPDCPFSRKANEFLAGRADTTRYVFLFPLKQLHPDAEKKARYILAQKERDKAFLKVLAGELDGKALPGADGPSALLDEMEKIGQSVGVSATPTLWIDGAAVRGADIPRMTLLLDNKQVTAAAVDHRTTCR